MARMISVKAGGAFAGGALAGVMWRIVTSLLFSPVAGEFVGVRVGEAAGETGCDV